MSIDGLVIVAQPPSATTREIQLGHSPTSARRNSSIVLGIAAEESILWLIGAKPIKQSNGHPELLAASAQPPLQISDRSLIDLSKVRDGGE